MIQASRRTRLATTALLGLALLLSGCAPEPGTQDGGSATPEGPGTSALDDPALKQQKLPSGFPSEEFAVPEGAVIDDAGERGPGVWFVVLRATDAAQADDWWERVIRDGGFTVGNDERTDDGGRAATLTRGELTVNALTIVQKDGSVLLNYDLS